MNINRWTFTGDVTGSLWVQARDRDHHHDTHTVYEGKMSNMSTVACNASISYSFAEHLALVGRFSYAKYYESTGSQTSANHGNGSSYFAPGPVAGMEHESTLYSLGLIWKIF